jgi:hypothetical protein
VQLDTDPPPEVAAQEIITPETGFELASFTTATSGEDTADPLVAVCPLPDKTVIAAAAPAVVVSVKVVGVEIPDTEAVTVLVPTEGPVVKLH